MTTLDIVNPWYTFLKPITNSNGITTRLFGRHALNTTSVVTVSSSSRLSDRQEQANLRLTDDAQSQLGPPETSLLPDISYIDLTWLQEALANQTMWSAATILENIDWSARQPGEIALGIRLALAFQALQIAREVAAQGYLIYPNDVELAKLHRVLAPPTTTTLSISTRPDIRSNLNWMEVNRETYYGQWVALDDGRLLAAADTIDALVAQVGDVRDTNVLITQLW